LSYEDVYDPAMERELTFLQFMTRLQDDVGRFRLHVIRLMREKPGLFDEPMSHVEWMKLFVKFLGMGVKKRPRSSAVTRVR
jgi:hypothetical protein